METLLYQDAALTITPAEIRSKKFTLYLRNVTSVSIGAIRPGKWAPLLLIPMAAMLWIFGATFPLGNISGLILLPMIPLLVLDLAYFCLRVSRVYLQTSGGPVVLAYNLSMWEPTETLERYERIKQAIEDGISSQKAPASA